MKRFLPFAIIIIVLVGAVAAGWAVLRSSRESVNAPTPTPDPAGEVKGAEPAHVRGNPNAPVTLEEFGDFQCPSCGSYHPELKKMEAEFGDKIHLTFREFPLVPTHQHALAAASAAEAAGLQGKFWEMHDLIYDRQNTWKGQFDVRGVFEGYAKEIGIDVDRYNRDVGSDLVQQRIFQDGKRGHSLGVKGTPTVFMNGREVNFEDLPADKFRLVIQKELEAAAKK